MWGFYDEGLASQAEYLTLRADAAMALIPQGIDYETMVACGEGAHYAYNFIHQAGIRLEIRALVNGATGAVGSSLVQLLKHYGAVVTAVGNTRNVTRIQSWGADRVIDYLQKDFTQDPEKYHVVFDTVAGSSFRRCKPLLFPSGVYVSSELGPYGQNAYLSLTTQVSGGKRVVFPVPKNARESLLFMNSLVREGKFSAIIDRRYPLDQIQDAYRYVERGEKTGNVIITY